MPLQALIDTATALLADHKGLLAMDESTPTCDKRFARLGIAQTPAMRRAWRDLIVTAPGLAESIGGAILHDETIRSATLDGRPFAQALRDAGIIPGIKVDAGTRPLALHAGETITEGLDGLRERLAEYVSLGARFAKWRVVVTIGAGTPTDGAIAANAHALARYAALCQEAGLVPIVEPEVLMDGDHPLARGAEVTQRTLHAVFDALRGQGVALEGMLLKPNMVVAGLACAAQPGVDEVADATIAVLRRSVPAAVAGIAFLSGGQSARDATARLNAMNRRYAGGGLPWPVAFSYARAIQDPAMSAWAGAQANVAPAQRKLVERARLNRLARRGEYQPSMEPD
jgi:fructose-bisphosphate aldolase class I